MRHVPYLSNDQNDIGGVCLSTSCLSIEKIFSFAMRSYALSQLENLLLKLAAVDDEYIKQNATLDEQIPCLQIKPFSSCLYNENVLVTVDPRSGAFCISLHGNTKSKFIKECNKFCSQFATLRHIYSVVA